MNLSGGKSKSLSGLEMTFYLFTYYGTASLMTLVSYCSISSKLPAPMLEPLEVVACILLLFYYVIL
jgi:hypothetical protein